MMIPKTIHYCWFGEEDKSPLIKACIDTWKIYLPDWSFVEWNEKNSPINHPFVKKALSEKKYAFAADYVRCFALHEYGGVYLDTDMELIRTLNPLLEYEIFAAPENCAGNKISCGVLGATHNHRVFKKMLDFYDKNSNIYIAIPDILTLIIEGDECKDSITILNRESFYPYNPFDSNQIIKQLMYADIKKDTYAIHHWSYSWKFSFLSKLKNKFLKIINRV